MEKQNARPNWEIPWKSPKMLKELGGGGGGGGGVKIRHKIQKKNRTKIQSFLVHS